MSDFLQAICICLYIFSITFFFIKNFRIILGLNHTTDKTSF
jgi:hypothetical protein